MPDPNHSASVKNATSFAANRSQLAELLGVSRQLVSYHLKNRPGNPGATRDGRYDVAAWKKYFLEFGTLDQPGQTGRGAARERMEALQAEKLAFQIQVLKKNYIPKSVVRKVMAQFINAAKTRSIAGVNRLVTLIRLAPDTVTACEVMRTEQLDIWREMSKGEWYQEPPNRPEKPAALPEPVKSEASPSLQTNP